MLTPYPAFSFEAVGIVGKAAKLVATGQTEQVNKPEALHACYELLGAGLGTWVPDGPPIFGSPGLTNFAEGATCCENLTAEKVGVSAPSIPWEKLIPLVLELIKLFLKK